MHPDLSWLPFQDICHCLVFPLQGKVVCSGLSTVHRKFVSTILKEPLHLSQWHVTRLRSTTRTAVHRKANPRTWLATHGEAYPTILTNVLCIYSYLPPPLIIHATFVCPSYVPESLTADAFPLHEASMSGVKPPEIRWLSDTRNARAT